MNPFESDPLLAVYAPESYSLAKHTPLRKTIARRLTLSQQTVPHFYLRAPVSVDGLLERRAEMNLAAPEGARLSLNDFMIRAYAMAIAEHPEANASWTEQGMMLHRKVDLCVAVAVPGGLIAPILRDCAQRDLWDISAGMKDLAQRARDRTLRPEDLQGGTASLSNLGALGVEDFAAIVNPPQATIAAIGAVSRWPVERDGTVAFSSRVQVTLSVDHRVIDGAQAAGLLATFKRHLESPETLA